MSIFNKMSYREGSSDWNTPAYVWDTIIPFIPREKKIWMPFYNDGYSGNYLREWSFDIIHKNEDFWNHNRGDCVVDNPPYNCKGIVKTKEKIMKRLIELDKPFMLLMPTTTIQTQYFKNIHNEHFQILVPKEKYNFEKSDGEATICPFYTIWVCYKMGFEKDYYII